MNKKNLIGILVLAILAVAVPLGLNLIRQQQTLKSRATEAPITFSGDNAEQRNGVWVVKDRTKPVTVTFTSPLGPPGVGVGSTGPHILQSVSSPAKGIMSFLSKSLVEEVKAQAQQVPGFATMPGGNAGEGCSVAQWAIIPPNPGPGQPFQITIKKGNRLPGSGWAYGGFARMWDGGNLSCRFAETNNTESANITAPNSPGRHWIEFRVNASQCGRSEEGKPEAKTCDRQTFNVQEGGGNSGPGECTVSWQLSPENPQPNTNITVTVQGLKSSTAGWPGITLLMDGQAVGNPQVDDSGVKPKFTYQNINSGSSGDHTLAFFIKNGDTRCEYPKTFRSGAGSSPSPSPSAPTSKECDFNGNNEYDDGDIINFWKDIFLGGGSPADQTKADCNKDRSIDLLDFNKWRNLRWHGSTGN